MRIISLPLNRNLDDGRVLYVYPLTFGRARLGISPNAESGVFDDVWDYDDMEAAVAAMHEWDGQGDPEGWMRHPSTGRRRPDGDASKEYIRE